MRTVELVRSVDQPGGYLIRVAWRDLHDHVETFLRSAAAQEFAPGNGEFFTGDPVVVHFEAEPVTAVGHNTRWEAPDDGVRVRVTPSVPPRRQPEGRNRDGIDGGRQRDHVVEGDDDPLGHTPVARGHPALVANQARRPSQ